MKNWLRFGGGVSGFGCRWLVGVAALMLLTFSTSVSAQTHPCDLPGVNAGNALAGTSLTLSVCSDGKDTNGNVQAITGWALYDNAVRTTPTLVKGTTSAVSGLTQYTVAVTAPATASVHTYQMASINAVAEGAKSSPFVLTVTLPLTAPDAPVRLTFQ